MIADEGLAWVFTAWFSVLGAASLVGVFRARNVADRLSYIAHVVMLAAMALMPWPVFMAVPSLVWIVLFGVMGLGYLVLALSRPRVALGPGAGHHAVRLVAWYHAAMMLGMVWMVVLMELMHVAASPNGLDLADLVVRSLHSHGSVAAAGAAEIPPLWQLPLWAVGITYLVAAMFAVAAIGFLAQLRRTPAGSGRGQALPARTELVIGAAIAVGMAVSFFIMS